jgi:hypothetical protein
MLFILPSLVAVRSLFRSRAALELEILALRHQICVLQRGAKKRPRLTSLDRFLWAVLSRIWGDWRSALAIVQPETVIGWHRKGFRLFWTWKVRRGKPGRPGVSREVRDLIRRISRENPLWGAPHIHGELLKLAIEIGETSVAKYMFRPRKPPSQTWRTFLNNHLQTLVSVDFFTVPTIRFQVLYVFLVLAHERRRVVHFNVTAHPTAEWTAQQLREARGAIGSAVAVATGLERVIGSVRRECLDHVIVFNEGSLRRILASYFSYYHETRPHLSLEKDSPTSRPVQRRELGRVVAAQVGGLHHRYERRAA